jgi:hypothetical protein
MVGDGQVRILMPTGRPFIEFIHSQDLAWTDMAEGLAEKRLSEGIGGAVSRLVRAGQAAMLPLDPALAHELFVLDGTVEIGGVSRSRHSYAYLPRGEEVTFAADAVVLAMTEEPLAGDDPAINVDTIATPWDRSGLEGEIAHLNYARKNLRLAPDGSRRTYLLGGMPHGHPADGARMERHPHDEEMFMIAGDMPCSLGVMTAGAYFYRPAGIWHGLDCTLGGFLILMRTPGSNVTVSDWNEDLQPVTFDPAHAPELPSGHAASSAGPRRLVPAY